MLLAFLYARWLIAAQVSNNVLRHLCVYFQKYYLKSSNFLKILVYLVLFAYANDSYI